MGCARRRHPFGADDDPIAEIVCEGDGPWPVTGTSGAVLGELLAGEPGPARSPSWVEWALFTDVPPPTDIDSTWASGG